MWEVTLKEGGSDRVVVSGIALLTDVGVRELEWADISKAGALGYEPQYSLEDGLGETISGAKHAKYLDRTSHLYRRDGLCWERFG